MKEPVFYEIKKSKRKTLSIEVHPDGRVIVRAPMRASKAFIKSFVEEKREWILEKQRYLKSKREEEEQRRSSLLPITDEQIAQLKEQMRREFPERVERFARIMGVSYERIGIRCQKTKWGSCSKRGSLNFNCLLMLAPRHIQDYIIVHELSHLRHMDHSAAFWNEVASTMPDYKICEKWLKEEGSDLFVRAFDIGREQIR